MLTHVEAIEKICSLGIGLVSARGALKIAQTSPEVYLGDGWYLAKAGTDQYKITRRGR